MRPQKHNRRALFHLEPLESRTLLAGVDASAALSATGSYLVNSTGTASDSAVTIAGAPGVDLTIDLALLPTAVKNLNITGFDHVVLMGTGQLDSLTLGHLGIVSGNGLDVQTVSANDVSALSLHAIKVFGTLDGHEMRLEVFDSRSATIFSSLDKLTVASSNGNVVGLFSLNPNQEIWLDFSTSNLPLGFTQKVVLQDGTVVPRPSTSPEDVQVVHRGETPGDVINTFDGRTYTVVVLTLSNAKDAQLVKLQDALKQGDFESARNFVTSYLKANRGPDGTYVARFPTTTLSELNLSEFGRLTRAVDRNVDLGERHAMVGTAANATDSNPVKLRLFEGQENATAASIAAPFAIDVSAQAVASGVDGQPITFIANSADHAVSLETVQTSAATTLPMLEIVRSALSNLAVGVNDQTNTVSAYIIGRLGNQLQPGERPGLLVDAKPSRIGSERDSMWIQV